MTTLRQTAARPLSLSLETLLRDAADRLRAHRVYARTRAELSRLTDRDLDDLGILRGDIDAVAREAAEMTRHAA